MTKGLRITVEDLETGDVETMNLRMGNYFILTTEPCHVAHEQHYPKSGTIQLTIKDWKPAPSAADGPQAICVQCFVVFPISHGEAEWIKEDGVRLLCPECCHDATGIDQWNDGDPSAEGEP